jgi:hypothetical protein
METKISDTIILVTPKGYEKKELPYFNEWVKALRSGEYKQGVGTLFRDNKYCCLGVLSKVQGRLTAEGSDHNSTTAGWLSHTNPCNSAFGSWGSFDEGVWLFLEDRKEGLTGLTDVNDAGATFEEIATIIETLWKSK